MSAILGEGLVKKFHNQAILSGLNINVREKDIYGLVGLNGIGKTTLIKILLSICMPDEGKIKIFGHEFQKNNASNSKVRKKICYLPEKFTPSSELTGREVIEMLSKFHRNNVSEKEIHDWCFKFYFEKSDLKRKIKHYSKGMIQKMGLISTFITKSKLYILDEPMSGLDFQSRNVLKEEITRVRDSQNATIFFTSHVMSDIEDICNCIGVLHNGELVFEGDINELKKKDKNVEKAVLKLC